MAFLAPFCAFSDKPRSPGRKVLGRKARHWPHFRPRCVEMLEDRVVPSFVAPLAYDVATDPRSVVVGDFNGDGIPDLAVANLALFGGPSGVSVLLGNGDGTFQPARTFPAGSNPFSVAVGDFDGDGTPDLAVADFALFSGTPGVSVLLGTGDGTFQPAHHFAAGINPRSIAVGDFDGDGTADIAVANDGGNNISVLLGNGDGTFKAPLNFAAGTEPTSIVVGDFNGDGTPDIAVTNIRSNTVSVLLGNGDGTFQAARNFDAGTNPIAVTAGHFYDKHILDLVVANYNTSGTIGVLRGNGDGTFQAPVIYAAGDHPSAVAMGDFNGDGTSDLAVVNDSITGTLSVFLGNGDGTFQPAAQSSQGAVRRG